MKRSATVVDYVTTFAGVHAPVHSPDHHAPDQAPEDDVGTEGDDDDKEELGKLARYMRAHFPACVLMPATDGGKVPRWPHKNGQYTWETWSSSLARGEASVRTRAGGVDGCLLRLTDGLIVVDVDSVEVSQALEDQGLGFERAAVWRRPGH